MARAGTIVGAIVAVLGAVLLVAGAAAAVYGFVDGQGDHVLRDPERRDLDRNLLMGGTAAAALGLVLLLAGLVALSSRRAAEPAGPAGPARKAKPGKAGSPKPAASERRPSSTPSRGAVLGAAGAAVAIVAGLVAAVLWAMAEGENPLFGDPEPEGPVFSEQDNGTLMAGRIAGIPGAPPLGSGHAEGTFTPPSAAARCTLTLDWDPADAGSADQLTLRLVRAGEAVAEATGPPNMTLELTPPQLEPGKVHTYQVHPTGTGFVSEAYQLRVACFAA